MNTIWSDYIQGVRTLYDSRALRFHDIFRDQFLKLFALNETMPLRILEIGCGPGALAGALHRWFPKSEITAIDRDTEFIRFARAHEPGIRFLEGDAVQLPFEEESFDVTISNTVSEHIEPGAFYGEQKRVLKKGGVCIVLSSRKGINHASPCVKMNAFEEEFWNEASKYDDSMQKYGVCAYPASEMQLPLLMEAHGFSGISTGYAVCPLTPDDPAYPCETAHAMINANRMNDLEALLSVRRTMPGRFSEDTLQKMEARIHEKFDARIRKYDAGEREWDTNVSIIMAVRGVK